MTTRFRTLASLLILTLLALVTGCSADQVAGGMEEAPPADTAAPSVQIAEPIADASLTGEVTLQATVTDDGTPTKVEFYANGELVGTSQSAPWTVAWDTTPMNNGTVMLQARAYDAAANTGDSPAVRVEIDHRVSLTFVNTTPTSLSIDPSGQSARTVGAGKSTTFVYDRNPGSVSYKANAKDRYGLMLYWNKSVSTANDTDPRVSISIGSGYFHLSGRNSSSRTTSSLRVNYQASNDKEVKPFSLSSKMDGIGYFKGSGATRVRVYAKFKFGDLGPVYWDFASDITSSRRSAFVLGGAGKGASAGAASVTTVPVEAPTALDGLVHEPTGDAPIPAE